MGDGTENKNIALNDFETGSVPRLLFNYSVPSMLALIAMAAYETIDRIFIGRFVGDTGLAVMGVGLPFIMLLNSVCLMIRVGAASSFSRRLGKGDMNACTEVLGNTFAGFIFCGFILVAVGNVLAEPIVRLCGVTENILADTINYVRIISWGAPFFLIAFGANSLMRAAGAPRQGLFLIAFSCGVNIILDAIFIGHFGWGVPGAAWATVISQVMGAGYGLWHFSQKNSLVRLTRHNFVFRFQVLKEIASVGFAYALFEISFILIAAISLNMLSLYGDSASLAQIAIINSCVAFLYMPLTGLDEGLQPIVGYNFGANNKERVKKAVLWALGIGIAFFSAVFLVIHFGAEFIVAIFITDNPGFQEMTARALRITFAVAPLMAVMIIVPGVLSALGEVKFNLILNIGVQILVQIPILFILPRFLGADGVWMSYPIVDTVSTVLGLFFLYKSLKRNGVFSAPFF